VEPKTVGDLKPAPYNPRTITKDTAKQLKRYMREFGDLSGIVWNKRTGHLVGGHQRVSQLPESSPVQVEGESGTVKDSAGNVWHVRVVDWEESKEKRANVVANNPALQGWWDIDLLGSLLTEVPYESVGFELMDIETAGFAGDQLEEILGRPSVLDDVQEPRAVQDAMADLEEMASPNKGGEKEGRGGSLSDTVTAARQELRQRDDRLNYNRTVVFPDAAAARAFMALIGQGEGDRYIDGPRLARLLTTSHEDL